MVHLGSSGEIAKNNTQTSRARKAARNALSRWPLHFQALSILSRMPPSGTEKLAASAIITKLHNRGTDAHTYTHRHTHAHKQTHTAVTHAPGASLCPPPRRTNCMQRERQVLIPVLVPALPCQNHQKAVTLQPCCHKGCCCVDIPCRNCHQTY